VKNFEENDVAGSVIFNFSDAEWKDLIPSMGFRKFVCQALKTKETTCHQEMRTVFRNKSKQKSSAAVQSKPTVKDMPSKLPITSYFSPLKPTSVINDDADISEVTGNLTTEISAAVPLLSDPMFSASNVEKFIAQVGKNQDGKSTLLLLRACLELCVLLHPASSQQWYWRILTVLRPRSCWRGGVAKLGPSLRQKTQLLF
jgi:hypothetical protein